MCLADLIIWTLLLACASDVHLCFVKKYEEKFRVPKIKVTGIVQRKLTSAVTTVKSLLLDKDKNKEQRKSSFLFCFVF